MLNELRNYLINYNNQFDYSYIENKQTKLYEKAQSCPFSYRFNRLEKIGNFLLTPLGWSVQTLSNPTSGKIRKVVALVVAVAGLVFALIGIPLKMMGEYINPRGQDYASLRRIEGEISMLQKEYQKVTLESLTHPGLIKFTEVLDRELDLGKYKGSEERVYALRSVIGAELAAIHGVAARYFWETTSSAVWAKPQPNDWEDVVHAREQLDNIRSVWSKMCRVQQEDFSENIDPVIESELESACGNSEQGLELLQFIKNWRIGVGFDTTLKNLTVQTTWVNLTCAFEEFRGQVLKSENNRLKKEQEELVKQLEELNITKGL